MHRLYQVRTHAAPVKASPNKDDKAMNNAALIVAAGRGSRMMQDLPKQYTKIRDQCILWYTIQAFLSSHVIQSICVVIHPDDQNLYDAVAAQINDKRLSAPVQGGLSRSESVNLGLQALNSCAPNYVLIHDAARPFCSPKLIKAVIDALEEVDGAFAALPVVDALWRVDGTKAIDAVSREGLWRAQTPQAFRYQAILAAYMEDGINAADDVEVARAAGLNVCVVEGEETNFKITLPADLTRAERFLASSVSRARSGCNC